MKNRGPVGKTYLVDLDSIEEAAAPTFAGYPDWLRPSPRPCIKTVCPDCRGHYTGKLPLEVLKIEADA